MSQYQVGQVLYIVHSGQADLINNQVQVVGAGYNDSTVDVVAVGDWTFPHGATQAHITEAYLSSAPTRK